MTKAKKIKLSIDKLKRGNGKKDTTGNITMETPRHSQPPFQAARQSPEVHVCMCMGSGYGANSLSPSLATSFSLSLFLYLIHVHVHTHTHIHTHTHTLIIITMYNVYKQV